MDTLGDYRRLVEAVLKDQTRVPFANGDIEIQTVFDREADRYLVMLVGRDTFRRVHGCLVQVDIINGKLWIQRDGTYYGVTEQFIEAGVPKEHIVLAFHSQEERELGEFAAA